MKTFFAYLLCSVIATGIASPLPEQGAPAEIKTSCRENGMLAITFDDGPSPRFTRTLLETLKENGIKATFFLNAVNIGNIEDPNSTDANIVREAHAAGHVIASHTYGHQDLATTDEDGIVRQLCWVDRAIDRIIGKSPRFLRAPYGSVNDQALRVIGRYGYTLVHWNIDTNDWRADSTVQSMTQAYLEPMRNYQSNIALQHDIHSKTVNDFIPVLLPELKQYIASSGQAWQFVTVDQCLAEEPYRANPWQSTDPAGEFYCPPRF